jgi:predicted secreted protein
MNNGLFIQGNNVHIYKYIDASPFEIVCGTNIVLEFLQEIIGATTPDSGKYLEKRARMRSVTATISGATTSDNDGNLSVFHFLNEDIFGEAQDLEVIYTDNDGSDRSVRGLFIIERLPITGEAGNSSTYDINLQSSGGYTVSTLIDPVVTGENVTSDSYVVSGGKITDSRWAGLSLANIIEVCREGTEQLSMGLPFTFDESTTSITPDPGTTMDGQRMFVIWTS